MHSKDVGLEAFLATGFNLKTHLANYLEISEQDLESRLIKGSEAMAQIHPGAFSSDQASSFYEEEVGDAHLLDLASWHLASSDYIADTLRLQEMFARGQVLDFGGGIGSHAIAAAGLPNVDHVWFVDLNPQNRNFVKRRAESLGLSKSLSVHRDLESLGDIEIDTLVCLDVLEHLPDPSSQLRIFHQHLTPKATAILNWYFFKGFQGEYPFHFDDPELIETFFRTLQTLYLEVFHPLLITARAYKPILNL